MGVHHCQQILVELIVEIAVEVIAFGVHILDAAQVVDYGMISVARECDRRVVGCQVAATVVVVVVTPAFAAVYGAKLSVDVQLRAADLQHLVYRYAVTVSAVDGQCAVVGQECIV